jgi:hypothetical protein
VAGDGQLIADGEDPVVRHLARLAPGELQQLGLAGQPTGEFQPFIGGAGLQPALRQ